MPRTTNSKTLSEMLDALEAYIDYNGALHDDNDCPQDDTCDCSTKWINDGINALHRHIHAEAHEGKA